MIFLQIDQLQFVRNLPISGFSLFATENLTPSLQGLLSRVPTSEKPPPLPYRKPFQTALVRYQSLQKEWKFLGDKQQLKIDKNTLRKINIQGQQLEQALEKLATNPSEQNLRMAQQTLKQFEQRFPNWMSNHRQVNGYQVQIWENRLQTIDKLLSYGQKRIISNSKLR